MSEAVMRRLAVLGLTQLVLLAVLLMVQHELQLQRGDLLDVKEQQTAIRYFVCGTPGLDSTSGDWARLKCARLPGLVRRARPARRDES